LQSTTLLSARTIRIEPALTISYKLLDKTLDRLDDTLKHVRDQYVKDLGEKETREKSSKDRKPEPASPPARS
jgi:hypothetical protein